MQVTGIIIAGGKNTRMGVDKAFLQVGSETMVEKAIRQLKKAVDRILIVSPRPEAFSYPGCEVISDIYTGCGPLGGLHAGLTYSNTDVNLVTACDMPFISPSLMKYLAGFGEQYDVVIPRLDGYLEPLSACYNKSCLREIEEYIKSGIYKITSFFYNVDVLYVDREVLSELTDPSLAFINVNSPRDLEKVRELLNKYEKTFQ